MDKRCQSCIHWGWTEYPRPFVDGAKRCEKLEKALEQDGDSCGGAAALGTLAKFGCVMWEPTFEVKDG